MTRGRRFLLFSNEAVGLGHLTRTIAITARLARTDLHATSLIVTGSPVQALFELPPRVEAVTLPTLTRDGNGRQLEGLRELAVHVDRSSRRKGELLAAAAREHGAAGVMLHHALIDADEREQLELLLAFLASHGNARCVLLASFVGE